MAAAQARELQEVEAVRQARLEAQRCRFQLEQAHGELDELRRQVAVLAAAGPAGCALDELREARLAAADSKVRADLAELELAKQLDALQELQWQLDCVVAQLGLGGGGAGAQGASAGAAVAVAEPMMPPGGCGAPPGVDPMLLLSKVEELRMAQLQLEEHKRRLAFAEAQLVATQARCSALEQRQEQQQQQQARWRRHSSSPGDIQEQPARQPPAHQQQQPGVAVLAAAEDSREEFGEAAELGAGGRALVADLLSENDQLRRRLDEAEERYRGLEREYEVELLMRADLAEAASAAAAAAAAGCAAPATGLTGHGLAGQRQQGIAEGHGPFDAFQQPAGRGSSGSRRGGGQGEPGSSGGRQPPAAVRSPAQQRLELRLQEKDAQLGKLRGVVRELEGKLIDAYKRQADMAMKESSWQEQEAQNRRIAQLDEERVRLAFVVQAAQAEAEAARREAAVQRRLAKRLQQTAAAATGQDGGSGGGSQMVELLQKRVRVLEAQNIRLRLQAKSSKEEEELAAAEAAAAARRVAARSGQGSATGAGAAIAADPATGSSAEEGAVAAAENGSPNRVAGGSSGMLAGNPVLERWEADKRLQKRVETLQTKLRDKTTALVSAQAGSRRAEEQVQALEQQLMQCQAAVQQLHAALRQAEQRAAPGTMVPVAQCHDLLRQLEQLQQQYDALERRHAELQQRVPGSAAAAGGIAPSIAPENQGSAASDRLPAASAGVSGLLSRAASRAGGAYCPSAYGGSTGQAGQQAGGSASVDSQAQLLETEVALFDAQLKRDQAVAEAERLRCRLHTLLDALSPHLHDAAAAGAIAEARQLAGLPPKAASSTAHPMKGGGMGATAAAAAAGGRAASAAGRRAAAAGGSSAARPRGQAGCSVARERDLLDTIELLKSALERTKKGLESGVSSSKYMAAVERGRQLKAQVAALEAQLADAGKVREELARVQRELGALHGTVSALRAQLKAAKERREEAASAREHMLGAQVSELERTLRERDAQMEALNAGVAQVDEEVRVLVAEGLRPADLIQELLLLRPRVREVEERNQELQGELAAYDAAADDLEQIRAEHELLRQQCRRWEGQVRALCTAHGEPLPPGLVPVPAVVTMMAGTANQRQM